MTCKKDEYLKLLRDTKELLLEQYPADTSLLCDSEISSSFSSPSQPTPAKKIDKAPIAQSPVTLSPVPKAPILAAPVPTASASKKPLTQPPVEKTHAPNAPTKKTDVPRAPVTQSPVPVAPVTQSPIPKTESALDQKETWKALSQKLAPNWTIKEEIPSDEDAKRNAARWKESHPGVKVLVLYFQEKELDFLQKLTQAIDTRLTPAILIDAGALEKEKKVEHFLDCNTFTYIIAPLTLLKSIEYKKHYKELPARQESTLKEIPLLLLPEISTLQDPSQKKTLWNTLCQRLKS